MSKAERHQERPTTDRLRETSHSESSIEEINKIRSQREPTRGLPKTVAHGDTPETRERAPDYTVSGPRVSTVGRSENK